MNNYQPTEEAKNWTPNFGQFPDFAAQPKGYCFWIIGSNQPTKKKQEEDLPTVVSYSVYFHLFIRWKLMSSQYCRKIILNQY